MTYKEFSSPHSSESPIQDSARVADLLSLPLKPLAPLHLAAQPPRPQTHLKPCRSLFRARSGGEKGLRGSGAGTLGVPLEGTRRCGQEVRPPHKGAFQHAERGGQPNQS